MQNEYVPLNHANYPVAEIQKMNLPTKVQPSAPIGVSQQIQVKPLLGPDNTVTTCQFCSASIRTAVKRTLTTRTHMTAVLCNFICCCCWIPYCMDSAKNTDHYCPQCQRYLGTYER